MKSVNLPTAIVLCVFIIAWTLLAFSGRPIPSEFAAIGAIVGQVILSLMPSVRISTGNTLPPRADK